MENTTKEKILDAALIHYCDREPDKKPEILGQIEAFVKHFIMTYRA